MQTKSLIVKSLDLPGLSGKPAGYVPGIILRETQLRRALLPYEDALETWVQCGGYSADADPITERDAEDGKIWTAANNALTRAVEAGVMGGRKRWLTTNQTNEGLRADLSTFPATWPGFTIIFPDIELVSMSQNTFYFALGSPGSQRLTLYSPTNGRIDFHNGTGGTSIQSSAGIVTTGTRFTLMATWAKEEDGTGGPAAIYLNSPTPVASGHISINPDADSKGAAILGSPDNNGRSNAYASQCIIHRVAITDTDDIAAVLAACAGIRSYSA